MPSVTVGTSPTLVYSSVHGTRNLPTFLMAQVVTDSTTVFWTTDPDDTDTPSTETGDTFQDDDMRAGQSWYAYVASGTADITYDVKGSK